MRFRIAHPRTFGVSAPGDRNDIPTFFATLVACLESRGHQYDILNHTVLPPADPDVHAVTLGYHSRGRRPRTWHVKRSYLYGYFYVDRDGHSGWSEMARSSALFERSLQEDETASLAFVEQMRRDYFDRGMTKIPQSGQQFTWDGRPYVFLPLQISVDTVMRLSRVDYTAFARAVAQGLAGSGYRLVVKRHPACTSLDVFRLLAELSAHPHVHVTTAAVGTLMRHASAVVCINSGVGFESLFHGCPVITAGRSDYEWVTAGVNTVEDLAELPRLVEATVDRGRVSRFLKYFCCDYLVKNDDVDRMMRWLASVEQAVASAG